MDPVNISLNIDNSKSYSPGDSLSGKVIVTSSKECVVESIFVTIVGQAKVDFHSGRDNSVQDNLFHSKIVLAGDEKCPVTLPANSIEEYRFSFPLPKKLPSSLNAGYGKIHYYAFAGIDQLGNYSSPVISRKPFTVESVVNLNEDPAAMRPVVIELHKELKGIFSSKGIVFSAIKLPKSGFALGENIQLYIDVQNQSTEIVKTSVALEQKICFQRKPNILVGERFTKVKRTTCQLAVVQGPLVECENKETWKVYGLVVSSDCVPCTDNDIGSLISVQYELKVKIYTEDFTISKQKIPLIIGTIPSLHENVKVNKHGLRQTIYMAKKGPSHK